MGALYNDIEKYAVELLNLRIDDGWLPAGTVTDEDIRTLCKKDLSVHGQVNLFAGIGGFPLACRMAGLPDDFRFFSAGFPCQPFSVAGRRDGTQDNRYLWPQTLAALKSHRPDVAILENVAGLATMAFPSPPTVLDIKAYRDWVFDYFYRKRELGVLHQICEDVEQAGYTVQPFIIPACAVDAKHRRDRAWIVCIRNDMENADGSERRPRKSDRHVTNGENARRVKTPSRTEPSSEDGREGIMADANHSVGRTSGHTSKKRKNPERAKPNLCGENVSDADSQRLQGDQRETCDIEEQRQVTRERPAGLQCGTDGRFRWTVEPAMGRLVNGLPGRVDRIKGLGNAIVPQVAAEIIRLIMQAYGISRSG